MSDLELYLKLSKSWEKFFKEISTTIETHLKSTKNNVIEETKIIKKNQKAQIHQNFALNTLKPHPKRQKSSLILLTFVTISRSISRCGPPTLTWALLTFPERLGKCGTTWVRRDKKCTLKNFSRKEKRETTKKDQTNKLILRI
jgi:hypothetical protein